MEQMTPAREEAASQTSAPACWSKGVAGIGVAKRSA